MSARSWKFEVRTITDGDHWSSNGQRFTTKEAAEASARDLYSRWTLVTAWQVVESDDEPNQTEPTIKGAGHRVQL